MIDLKDYILQECGEGAATPGNTMGMGNPMAPGEDVVGSGDIPNAGSTRLKKRKKKIKDGEEHKYDKFTEGMFDENIFDDDFGVVDIDKWFKNYKKQFRSEVGYGLTNPNTDLFTSQQLAMFKSYLESHQISSKSKNAVGLLVSPEKHKIEIYLRRDNGTLAIFAWCLIDKLHYTCQIVTHSADNYWDLYQKSSQTIFVNKRLMSPIVH